MGNEGNCYKIQGETDRGNVNGTKRTAAGEGKSDHGELAAFSGEQRLAYGVNCGGGGTETGGEEGLQGRGVSGWLSLAEKKVAEVLRGRRMIQMSGGGQVGHLSPGRSQSCTGTPAGEQRETRR